MDDLKKKQLELENKIDQLHTKIDALIEADDDAKDILYGTTEVDIDQFVEAVQVIVHYDRCSASLIQRRMGIGYNQASRLVDMLEAEGVISKADGSRPRVVLIADSNQFLKDYIKKHLKN